jgi:exonuclease III
MKLATWNVNSLKVWLPQVLDFLAVQTPDVLCLQETKLEDDKFRLVICWRRVIRRYSQVRRPITASLF